ncbi:MAG: hypothetical protein ACQET5_12360 [Halobacteriota archaeon]|uniref:hypothetical protein n=1 Tax=Natronomonas sp. TaxID=2184060 RepID=UPI003975BC6A
MSENTSTYGKTGAAGLLAAVLVWGVAVVLAETGANPDTLTQSLGYVGLALLAIGAVALAAMLVGIYTDAEL